MKDNLIRFWASDWLSRTLRGVSHPRLRTAASNHPQFAPPSEAHVSPSASPRLILYINQKLSSHERTGKNEFPDPDLPEQEQGKMRCYSKYTNVNVFNHRWA
ncbi:unnamed protein product [Ophioblennius macclurei]